MDRLKEFFLKNNYLALKITAGVVAVGIAATAITVIATSGKGQETGTGDKGSSAVETTMDIVENDSTLDTSAENQETSVTDVTSLSEDESTTLVAESTTSEEESITTNQLALGNDDTTTTKSSGEAQSSVQEQTTTGSDTGKKPTTSKQQMTSSSIQATTTTQAPTTTQKPTTTTTSPVETTTEEETTTAPPRGANGVILEELVCNRVSGAESLPKSFAELVASGTENTVSKNLSYLSVPNVLNPNVLGNEILVYNKNDTTGSVEADIIAIYGEPLYRYTRSDTGGVRLIYKYLTFGENNERDLYMRFAFSKDKDDKLIGITLTSFEQLKTDGEFNP